MLNGAQHAAAPAFATPVFDGTDLAGVVLARVDAGGGAMFVEQGRARFADRRAHGSSPVLKAGDFISFAGSGRAVVEPRPASEFVGRMPADFRDSIPSRLARCRNHEVAARTVGEFSYGEVEAWINAEPAVRRQFVHAWRAKAEDTEFRFELTSKLSRHPEWGPVLFRNCMHRSRRRTARWSARRGRRRSRTLRRTDGFPSDFTIDALRRGAPR